MASIIKDENQIRACEQVNSYLNEVRSLNALIANCSEAFYVSAMLSEKKSGSKKASDKKAQEQKKVMVELDNNLNDKVAVLLGKQKERLCKEIQKLAKTYRIKLDKSELDLMKNITETEDPTDDPSDDDIAAVAVDPENGAEAAENSGQSADENDGSDFVQTGDETDPFENFFAEN